MLALVLYPPLEAAAATSTSTSTVTVHVVIHSRVNLETIGKISFAPSQVKAGSRVRFEITNSDPVSDHVFEMNGHHTGFIGSGRKGALTVQFTKPGRYVASCPDAYGNGIAGWFSVT
jgi:uncharacterized cupredoxin-like copper-binding protein